MATLPGSLGEADHNRDVLPVHPQPRADQIFSSWLLWLASGNGKSVKDFCRSLDESRIELIDFRHPNDSLVEALIDATGIDAVRIRDTLPSSLKGLLGSGPGFLWPYEVLHPWRLRADSAARNVGGQYCFICLREGGYFRVSWILALFTCCPVHKCLLLERCPHCGQPVHDSTRLFRRYEQNPAQAVLKCHACVSSLTRGIELHTSTCVGDEIERIHSELVRNESCIGYFAVLHKLLHLLCGRSAYNSSLRARILPPNALELRFRTLPAGSFEALTAQSRQIVLTAAVRLLRDWPDTFVDVMRQVCIPSSWSQPRRIQPKSLESFRPLPTWYHAAVKLVTSRSDAGRKHVRELFIESAAREKWEPILKLPASG